MTPFASQQSLKAIFPPQGPETPSSVMSYMLWRFMAVAGEGEAFDLEPRPGGPLLWLEAHAAFAREAARRKAHAAAEIDDEAREEAEAALEAWRRAAQEPILASLFPEGEDRRIRDYETALAAWRHLQGLLPEGADPKLVAGLEEHLAAKAEEAAETLAEERA